MLVVVSPAKKLNMAPVNTTITTEPLFIDNVKELVKITRKLNTKDLQNLMGISPNLAKTNVDRFNQFGSQEKKAACFAFAGDTYKGLDAASMNLDDLNWAQRHLRILSGLYGILRPLDVIEPYRLEMGSKLKNLYGTTLYEYWGNKISIVLNEHAKDNGYQILVNCASHEYFSAIDTDTLSLQVITPIFMERKDGKEKIVSFYAKNARGAMARFIIKNRLTEVEGLKSFNSGGYIYQPDLSDCKRFIYVRDYPKIE